MPSFSGKFMLLLFWTFLSSCLWQNIDAQRADVMNILTNIYGSVGKVKNVCDRDNKWWEISLGADPVVSGVRIGKHDTVRRNYTWFSFCMPGYQMGYSSTHVATRKELVRDLSWFITYFHGLMGQYCTRGIVPLSQLQSSPLNKCIVTGGIAQCPDNDDWNREFIWMNWDRGVHKNAAPLGIELKTRPGPGNYQIMTSLQSDNQRLDFSDILTQEKHDYMQRTLKIAVLGLTAIRKYIDNTLKGRTIIASECSVINDAGKKILHIDESTTDYTEPWTTFDKFSFGVPYQDELRKQAIGYKFKFPNGAPKVRKQSLYQSVLVGKEFVFRGNETYNEWSTGEVERWKFVNITSPLMDSPAKIEQIYVYYTMDSGYEVAKGSFPFADIVVARDWNRNLDTKKLVLNFNPSSVIPAMEITYTGRPLSHGLNVKLPTSNYGISVDFSCKLQHDGTLMWSVTKSDLSSDYKNKMDIVSGHVQTSAQHFLFVFKKSDLFVSHYTQFLNHVHKLAEQSSSNYVEFIYAKLREAIGDKKVDEFLSIVKEMHTLTNIYDVFSQVSLLYHPTAWQEVLSAAYKVLEIYGKVEDTESEIIVYIDMADLPVSHLWDVMDMVSRQIGY